MFLPIGRLTYPPTFVGPKRTRVPCGATCPAALAGIAEGEVLVAMRAWADDAATCPMAAGGTSLGVEPGTDHGDRSGSDSGAREMRNGNRSNGACGRQPTGRTVVPPGSNLQGPAAFRWAGLRCEC